jgi:ribosomal-protein-alanine N-acetyltransferase
LLGGVLARAAALGASRVLLEVAVDNAAARALYARRNFAIIGRRPGYYRRPPRPPVDALILRWETPADFALARQSHTKNSIIKTK